MTNIVATDRTTTETILDSDRLYVPADVEIIATLGNGILVLESNAVDSQGAEVAVDGTVVSFSDIAIRMPADPSTSVGRHSLIVGETGVVRSLNYPNSAGLFIAGHDNFVQNWGEVTGNVAAFFENADDLRLENHGVIAGTNLDGVTVSFGDDARILNTGRVTGRSALQISNSAAVVVNTGEIIGALATAGAVTVLGSGGITLSNSGLIEGPADAVRGGEEQDVVENSGLIRGEVRLLGGADIYDASGAGAVQGRVDGGEGEDTLSGGAAGDDLLGGNGNDRLQGRAGEDTLEGGDGLDLLEGGAGEDALLGGGDDDTLRGGRDEDRLEGGAGLDLLRGGAGDDTLLGGADADRAFGGAGDDEIAGEAGDDVLGGGAGDDDLDGGADADRLEGGAGDDTLAGGAGNDTLRGGRGDDAMTGGEGADVFRLTPKGDAFDVITDFESGEDTLDLGLFGIGGVRILKRQLSEETPDGLLIDLEARGGGFLLLEGADLNDLRGGDVIL